MQPIHPDITPALEPLRNSYEETRVLVTGGLGFIGSATVHQLAHLGADVLILDTGTYAANPRNLNGLPENGQVAAWQGDIADEDVVADAWAAHEPQIVLDLAAESHVDRSIENAAAFTRTNVEGTRVLLDQLRGASLEPDVFVHVSTDEVYGDIPMDADPVTETAAIRPSSPYSASKASGEFLALSHIRTYGAPIRVTRGSNTYGPRQFPEKLIPLMLTKALNDEELPVYGDGMQRRDWLHVDDHARALIALGANPTALQGPLDEPWDWASLNVAYGEDIPNMNLLEELLPIAARHIDDRSLSHLKDLIEHVEDRPGHDRRYALDTTRIEDQLGWEPLIPLKEGLAHTVSWYLNNRDWIDAIRTEQYRKELDHLLTDPPPVEVTS